jgi:hypothetical protein
MLDPFLAAQNPGCEHVGQAFVRIALVRHQSAQARQVASNALEHPQSVQPWRFISFD